MDHPTAQDPREKTLGILCQADLNITGTFQLGAPQPADVFGCWPVGVWTLHATVAQTDCQDAPKLEQQYQIQVTADADQNLSYMYMNDPTYTRVKLGVTEGGGGLCEGGFQIYSPDGKILTNLTPSLNADMTINGHGQYEVYDTDQWPY